jgi:hypothetical protein
LENGAYAKGGNTGWEAVHKDAKCINRELYVSLLKVAHHGSKGAQHLGVWRDIVGSQAKSILSPWVVGNRNWLPSEEELQFVRHNSIETYITSMNGNIGKPKQRGGDVDKLIRKVGVNLSEIKYAFGLIRAKWNVSSNTWDISFEGSASAA